MVIDEASGNRLELTRAWNRQGLVPLEPSSWVCFFGVINAFVKKGSYGIAV